MRIVNKNYFALDCPLKCLNNHKNERSAISLIGHDSDNEEEDYFDET